jgi:predicted metal-binding protein
METCLEFDPKLLVPQQKVRAACMENKCGSYGTHYMCPPHIGTIDEIKYRLKKFQRGVLLQYSQPVNVKSALEGFMKSDFEGLMNNDLEGLLKSMLDFHNKVLSLEGSLRKQGIEEIWGMLGGNCRLCEPCLAATGEPCLYPKKARNSLESIGIDVMTLLNSFGLDSKFRDDKITWTGCILSK